MGEKKKSRKVRLVNAERLERRQACSLSIEGRFSSWIIYGKVATRTKERSWLVERKP